MKVPLNVEAAFASLDAILSRESDNYDIKSAILTLFMSKIQ
jgi:hypothetical protein